MATDLKILGWEAKGLRCPDHEISFEKDDEHVHRVSLVQMPNGTGKTTTLKLLRAALTGPKIWDDSEFDKIPQFRKNKHTTKGQFDLKLRFNGRMLTIQLLFDFNTGSVIYATTTNNGKETRFNPPRELEPFLSPKFVQLLVFDGEQAAHLLDPRYTNAQKAIEEMFQLTLFKGMSERINEYWKDLAQHAGSSGDSKQLTRRTGRVSDLEMRIVYVSDCKKRDYAKLVGIKNKIAALDKQFHEQIKKNKQDALNLKDAESKLEIAKQALVAKTREMVILMKNPIALSQEIAASIYSLKENLDKAKLPGIAAREFFDEIAEEAQCICGRPIDEEVKQAIKDGAKKYLGTEEMNVLNAMKTDIRDRFPNGLIFSDDPIKQTLDELQEAQDREAAAQQDLDDIKLDAGANNPEIETIQQEINELNKSQGELEKEMEKYDDKNDDSDESWNPEILTKCLAKAKKDLADTTGTLEQMKKKDTLTAILEKSLQKSRELLSRSICEQANEKIATLMPDNNVRISVIDKSLCLDGKEGGSVGETLAVGYAFLSSLLSNKEHRLPSVVDSPSGPIDLQIRPEIGRLVPKLADQFIAFTISSERQNFVEPLVREAGTRVYFLTLFRKGNKQLEESARQTGTFQETDDGMLVHGKAYFEQFHSDETE